VASAGQILVSEQTLSKLGGKFETEELPAAQLKGKDKPFRIFDIKRANASVQVPTSLRGSA
jgi:class 3 adenylate cyclase